MKSAQELAEEYLGKDFPEAFGSNAWMLSKHAYIVGYEAGRASLEEENTRLKRICADLQWMAKRYADGRQTYATGMLNDATRELISMGVKLNPCGEEIIWARDGGGRGFDGLSSQEATPGSPEAMGIARDALGRGEKGG